MANQDGARPLPSVSKVPPAYVGQAPRPLTRTNGEYGEINFPVAADSKIGILTGNACNYNQGSEIRTNPPGKGPDSIAAMPEGKPSV